MLEYLLTEEEGNSLFRNVASYLPVETSYTFQTTSNFQHLLQFYVEIIVLYYYFSMQYTVHSVLRRAVASQRKHSKREI